MGADKKKRAAVKKTKTPKSVSLYRIPMDILRVTKIKNSKTETGSRRSPEAVKEYNPQNSGHSNQTTLPSFDRARRYTHDSIFKTALQIEN